MVQAPSHSAFDLGENFKKRFAIVPAITDELRHTVFRLRHQVYCEELGFEARRSDGFETDEHDAHALHLLLHSVQGDEFIGCTRLVRCQPGDLLRPLPFEKTCAKTLHRDTIDPARLARDRIAEVSRLAVIGKYRRRKGEAASPVPLAAGDIEEAESTTHSRRFPYILVALYLGTVALAVQHNIEILFVLTEPRLAAHFSKLGVEIRQIGLPVEHRGQRIPSAMHVSTIIEGLTGFARPLFQEITREIEAAHRR